MSTYLCFNFIHQPCLCPHGAPFMQPLNNREEGKSGEPEANDQDEVERFAAAKRERESAILSKAGRGGKEERWEEREEVGALSLVPLTETRYLSPEEEKEVKKNKKKRERG